MENQNKVHLSPDERLRSPEHLLLPLRETPHDSWRRCVVLPEGVPVALGKDDVRRFDATEGRHFWDAVVNPLACGADRRLFQWKNDGIYYLAMSATEFGMRSGSHTPLMNHCKHGAALTVHVWRIQRAVRAFLQRDWRRRRVVAVAMGWHSRLGKGSVIAGIPDELLYSMMGY